MNEGFILGGDGLDSIKISAQFGGGTLNGGAGADTITLSTYGRSGQAGGNLQGGAGADVFNLGDAGTLVSGDSDGQSGGSTLHYASFDESNLANPDVVSPRSAAPHQVITLRTMCRSPSAKTWCRPLLQKTIKNPATFTASNGVATFTSTFDNTYCTGC